MRGQQTDGPPVVVELRRPLLPSLEGGPGAVVADLRTAPPSRSASAASAASSCGGHPAAFRQRASGMISEELTSTSAERQRRSALHVVASASGLANELREILHRTIPALKRQVDSARDDVADARFTAAESVAVVNRVSTEVTRSDERRAVAEDLARKMAAASKRTSVHPGPVRSSVIDVKVAGTSHSDVTPEASSDVPPREDSTSPRLSFAATERDVSPTQPPASSSPPPGVLAVRGTPVSIPVPKPKAAVPVAAAPPVRSETVFERDADGSLRRPDDTLASWTPDTPRNLGAAVQVVDTAEEQGGGLAMVVDVPKQRRGEQGPPAIQLVDQGAERGVVGAGGGEPSVEFRGPDVAASGTTDARVGDSSEASTPFSGSGEETQPGLVAAPGADGSNGAPTVLSGVVVGEPTSTASVTQVVVAERSGPPAVQSPPSALSTLDREPCQHQHHQQQPDAHQQQYHYRQQHSPASRTVRAIPVRRVRTPEPVDRVVAAVHSSLRNGARGRQLHVPTQTPPVPQVATRTPRLPVDLPPQRRTTTPPPPATLERATGASALRHATPLRSHRRAIQTPPPAFFSDDDVTDDPVDAVDGLPHERASHHREHEEGHRSTTTASSTRRSARRTVGEFTEEGGSWASRVPVPTTRPRPRQPHIAVVNGSTSRSAVLSPQLDDDDDADGHGREAEETTCFFVGTEAAVDGAASRRYSPARPRITHRPDGSVPRGLQHRDDHADGDAAAVIAIEARLALLVANRHCGGRRLPANGGGAEPLQSRRLPPPAASLGR